MKRDEFLKTLGMGAAALPLSRTLMPRYGSHPKSGDRPNILFITTDYQAGEDLPTTGSPFLNMPNVARLSREGVTCENHYCTAPICMPARATLMTGQYPHTHGIWDNTGKPWPVKEGPQLMRQLSRGGYQTVGIGKMHFNPMKRMAGFDTRIIADNKGNGKYSNKVDDDYAHFLARHGLTRWSYLKHQSWSNLYGVYDWPYEERFHIDHFVGEQAVQFIKQNRLKAPWFSWVSFNGPHNPWDPPARYSGPYKRMDLPGPRARPHELRDKPADHTRLRYNYTRQVADELDQAAPKEKKNMIHRIRAGHYGGLSFIDSQIGRVLDALDDTGQLDNTIIIYSADHGCQLGDHHNIHKGLFYERSATVPFVVWSPSRFKPKRIQSYGGHVDFFPTVLSLAGIPIPDDIGRELEGVDISPAFYGDDRGARQRAFLEIRHGTGIVNNRWKFSVYPRDGDGELYDRQEDPEELYNLFDDHGYRTIRNEMQDQLIAFHPPLEEQIAKMRPLTAGFTPKDEWKLKKGQVLASQQAPYQQGKSIRMSAELKPSGNSWTDGPILVANIANVHGYAWYINDRHLELAVRRWNKDTVIRSPEPLPMKSIKIAAGLTPGGELTLWIDGDEVSSGLIGGGLPEQPGRKRITAPALHAGESPKWPAPMGAYKKGDQFKGSIRNLTLRLS